MEIGAQTAVRTLRELGAEMIFAVSGNQILSMFNAAAEEGLRIIHTRHESAAVYAAAGFAEIVGNRQGVVLTSAGPGFLAALTGVAAAQSMELPILLLSGSSATREAGSGGFQDLDQSEIAKSVCKETIAVTSCGEIASGLRNAWHIAQASVPGPVHVNLPEDLLVAETSSAPPNQERLLDAAVPFDPNVMDAMAECLIKSKRPIIVARPSATRGISGVALRGLTAHLAVQPIITESPRGFADPKYLGVARHYQDSDCVLAICPADFAVGFFAKNLIANEGLLMQIDAPGDPQPRRRADLHSQAPVQLALPYLAKSTERHKAATSSEWSNLWSFLESDVVADCPPNEGLHPLEVARQVRAMLAPDDVVVLDGGEFCQWIRLGLRGVENQVLWNGKLGAIGGSVPMALGTALSGHSRRTICFIGDGAFGYHASELETAARYGVPLLAIVGNDARWGAEWHLQAARYGRDRTFDTGLSSANYDLVAKGLGALSFAVTDCITLRNSVSTSFSSEVAACLDVKIQSLRSPARAHVGE